MWGFLELCLEIIITIKIMILRQIVYFFYFWTHFCTCSQQSLSNQPTRVVCIFVIAYSLLKDPLGETVDSLIQIICFICYHIPIKKLDITYFFRWSHSDITLPGNNSVFRRGATLLHYRLPLALSCHRRIWTRTTPRIPASANTWPTEITWSLEPEVIWPTETEATLQTASSNRFRSVKKRPLAVTAFVNWITIISGRVSVGFLFIDVIECCPIFLCKGPVSRWTESSFSSLSNHFECF